MADEEIAQNSPNEEKAPENIEEIVEIEDETANNAVEIPEHHSGPILPPPRPFYMKLIFSFLILSLLIWGGIAMCSSPKEPMKKNYAIALDPSWYPLPIPQKNMTAFVETLLKEFASKNKLRISLIPTTREKLLVDFSRGKYDGIISMLRPTPTITGGYPYVFSAPIYRLGPVLVVNKKSPYNSLLEMSKKVVGLVGDARFETNIDAYPEIIFTGYDNFAMAFADLNNKKVDALIVDSLQAKNFSHGLYQGKFRIANVSLSEEGILLIMHKNSENAHFLELFNAYLAELRKDDSYANLLKAWQVISE
jgi:ABC-type amino acid transport substrate-binding protein